MLVLQRLGPDQVSEATDIIAQRVKIILAAKTTAKGSWEFPNRRSRSQGLARHEGLGHARR